MGALTAARCQLFDPFGGVNTGPAAARLSLLNSHHFLAVPSSTTP